MPTIEESVVVITGASSGIGRATAMALAERGASLVLAARREKVLQEVAQECQTHGARTLVVPLDVALEADVRNLAQRAIEQFGRIDVWINNAAVTAFGRMDETPYHVYRRVIETNLFGYIHGARAVLPHFRQQGRGVLINVSSVAGKISQPFTSAYCVSKFGINGLSESLRMELRDTPDIHVCTILPPSVDTPIFQHAANHSGRAVKPMPPVHDVQDVVTAILEAIEHPQREMYVGRVGRQMLAMRAVAPATAERMMASQVEKAHFQDQPAPATEGNLFVPMETGHTVSGGWKEKESEQAEGSSVKGVGATAAAVGLLALGAAAYSLARRGTGRKEQGDGGAAPPAGKVLRREDVLRRK